MKSLVFSTVLSFVLIFSAAAASAPSGFNSELNCGKASDGNSYSLGSARKVPTNFWDDIQYYLVVTSPGSSVQYIPMEWSPIRYPYMTSLEYGDTTQYGANLVYKAVTDDIDQLPISGTAFVGQDRLKCLPN